MSLAHEITRRHGGTWHGSYGAIPTPGHGKRDRGTTLHDRADGGVIVNCFNGPWREVRDTLGLADHQARPITREERARFAKQREEESRARLSHQLKQANEIWRDGASPALGGLAYTYLTERSIPTSVIAETVAFGAIRERVDQQGRPGMLVLARNAASEPRAVQVTRLRAGGRGKLPCDYPRLTFGPLRGCAVRLCDHSNELAICEGVESALAFYALHHIPAWATLGTANIEAFSPPAGLRRLFIATDGDDPGRACAANLFERLKGRLRCTLAMPPDGQDWADVLVARRGARHVA